MVVPPEVNANVVFAKFNCFVLAAGALLSTEAITSTVNVFDELKSNVAVPPETEIVLLAAVNGIT